MKLSQLDGRFFFNYFKQAWFTVEPQKTGKIGTFCWTIPTDINTTQVFCLPQMEKWERKWRLFCAKRGGSIEYGLEYSQGVSPIHLCMR